MKLVPLVILLLLPIVPIGAHDGHGEVSVLIGTVKSVDKDRIQIETLDQTTLQLRNVWILLDEKTKFLIGKNRVDRLELASGHRIELAARSEHARDGSMLLRAMQVRLNQPRKPVLMPGAPRS